MLFNPCDICKENSSEQKEFFNKKVMIVRSLRLKKVVRKSSVKVIDGF